MGQGVVTVRAEWDDEAGVWVVESPDVPGLVIEAAHHDEIAPKALLVIEDLAEDSPDVARLAALPLEVVTTQRVTRRAVA